MSGQGWRDVVTCQTEGVVTGEMLYEGEVVAESNSVNVVEG